MAIKIKNWKLTLLGLLAVLLLASLGFWQLSRYQQKIAMLRSFLSRTALPPVSSAELNNPNDWRFYRATLTGNFDNEHTFLLDNKTHKGQIGYEVYTLFRADGLSELILVDRGFTPADTDRNKLPNIKPIDGRTIIHGMLNLPPRFVSLGEMTENNKISWPLRVEFIRISAFSTLLNSTIFPYILTLEPKSPYALTPTAIESNLFTISPERHRAYAFQWFALAATLLVICVVLNRE